AQKRAKTNRYTNSLNARSASQRVVMEQIERQGHCPFCIENLNTYHKNPILKKGKYWLLTENQWPYENVKHQLLVIYKTHIEHINQIAPKAWSELGSLFSGEAKKRKIEGGGLAIRFGSSKDGNYGSTVLHIHAHLIEPHLKKLKKTEAWKFKFGQPKDYKKK
ncbi:MAG: hypothetical protein AAB490_05570, partial [Patescibacteria group bacterium]